MLRRKGDVSCLVESLNSWRERSGREIWQSHASAGFPVVAVVRAACELSCELNKKPGRTRFPKAREASQQSRPSNKRDAKLNASVRRFKRDLQRKAADFKRVQVAARDVKITSTTCLSIVGKVWRYLSDYARVASMPTRDMFDLNELLLAAREAHTEWRRQQQQRRWVLRSCRHVVWLPLCVCPCVCVCVY